MAIDPVQAFMLSPQGALPKLAALDGSGTIAANEAAYAQWLQLAAPEEADDAPNDSGTGLLSSIPALGRSAIAGAGKDSALADALARVISAAQDPAWDDLVGDDADDLAIANPASTVMVYLQNDDVARLPHPTT